ncbi:MAG: fibronectin type III domain-containing protein, partial [bacterium]|nr:fibronectin type III domain-containing protein [bacterium]
MIRYSFDKLRRYAVGFFSVLVFVGLGVFGFFQIVLGGSLVPPTNVDIQVPENSCVAEVHWDWVIDSRQNHEGPRGSIDFQVRRHLGVPEEFDPLGSIDSNSNDPAVVQTVVRGPETTYSYRYSDLVPLSSAHYQIATVDLNSTPAGFSASSWEGPLGEFGPSEPSAPTAPTFTWVADNTLDVSWDAEIIEGVTGFTVFRKDEADGAFQSVGVLNPGGFLLRKNEAGEVIGAAFRDVSIDSSAPHWYKVQAFHTGSGCSPSQARVSPLEQSGELFVEAIPIPPSPPRSLTATRGRPVVTLRWEYNAGFDGFFEVQWTADEDKNGIPVWSGLAPERVQGGPANFSREFANLLPNREYHFRVRAIGVNGLRSDYEIVSGETGIGTPERFTAKIASVSASGGVVRLGWRGRSEIEDGYEVKWSSSVNGPWGASTPTACTSAANITSCLHENVPLGKEYFYKVWATKGGARSDFSEIGSVDLNVSPLRGWAWANAGVSQGNRLGVGWVSLSSENPGAGGEVPYGVFVNNKTKELSGWAWSGIQCTDATRDKPCGYGWLSFNKDELSGCPDGNCVAFLDITTNGLDGWAKFLAADPTNGAWTGWVSLRTKNREINGKKDNLPYGVCFGTSDRNGASCAMDGTFDAAELADKKVKVGDVQVPAGMLSGWAWGDNIGGWMQFIGLGVGALCTSDAECSAGEICGEGGSCVPKEPVCAPPCPLGQVCGAGNQCVTRVCTPPCRLSQVCEVGNKCVPPCTPTSCPLGQVCGVSGSCVGTGGDGCVFSNNPVIDPVSRVIPFSESVVFQVNIPPGCSHDVLSWSVGRINPGADPSSPLDDVFVPDSSYGTVSQGGTYTAPAVTPPGVSTLPFIATVKVEVPGKPFSDTHDIRVGDFTPQARAQCDVSDPARPYVSVQWSGAPRVLHDVEILRASSDRGPLSPVQTQTLRDANPTGWYTDAGVALHGEYYYKVRIFNIAGRAASAGDVVTSVSRTVCESPTVAPTYVRVFTQDEKTLFVNWMDNDTRSGHTFTLERMRVTPARPAFTDAGAAVRPLSDSNLLLTWTNATNWTPYTHLIQRTKTADVATRFTKDDAFLQEFGAGKGAPSRIPDRGASPQTLSFPDNSLVEEGTTYYYRISSCSLVPLAGKYKEQARDVEPAKPVAQPDPACSLFSDTVSATTMLRAPSGFRAEVLSSSEIQLSWQDNSGNESGYEIWQSESGGGFVKLSSASASLSGLKPDTDYSYKVRAFHGTLYSEFSPTVGARTEKAAAAGFQVTVRIEGVGEGTIRTFTGAPQLCVKGVGEPTPKTCDPFEVVGSSVVLEAVPAGSVFAGWTGCNGGLDNNAIPPRCVVTGEATVVATFNPAAVLRGADKLYASVFDIVRGRLGGLSAFVRGAASPLFEGVEVSQATSLRLPRNTSQKGQFQAYDGQGFASVWNSFTSFLLKSKETLISLLSSEFPLAESAVDYERYFDEVGGALTQAVYKDEHDRTNTLWDGLAPDSVYIYRVKSCPVVGGAVGCTAWSDEAAGKTLFFVPGPQGAPVVRPTNPDGSRIPRPICTKNSFCDYSIFNTISPRNETGLQEESEQQCRVNADCANVGRSE